MLPSILPVSANQTAIRRTCAYPINNPNRVTCEQLPSVEPAHPLDLTTEIRRPRNAADTGVETAKNPGGRCAVLRMVGNHDDLRPAAEFRQRDGLPASGNELRDMPLHAQRVSFFPNFAEHEAITDLFLPLRQAPCLRSDGRRPRGLRKASKLALGGWHWIGERSLSGRATPSAIVSWQPRVRFPG